MVRRSSCSVSSAVLSAALWCIRARSRASSLAESWNLRIDANIARPPVLRAHNLSEHLAPIAAEARAASEARGDRRGAL